MDDTVIFQNPQAISGQPVNQNSPGISSLEPSADQQTTLPNTNPPQPNAQSWTPSSTSTTKTSPQPNSQSTFQASENTQPSQGSPRITLTDLYGPSRPSAQNPQTTIPSSTSIDESTSPVQSLQTPLSSVQPETSMQPQVESQIPVQETPQTPVQSPNFQETTSPQSQPLFSQHLPKQSVSKETVEEHKGFGFGSIMRFATMGGILLIIILVVFFLGSLLFKKGPTSSKVTLVYWGLWEDANVYSAVISDFERQHPNIIIEYTKQDPKDYVKRLLTRTQQGNGPDMFRFNNSWIYPLQSLLLPLSSDVIDGRQLSTQYPSVITTDLIKNGALYGLPLEMDTLSLFVNKDIFTHAGASVPTSWDNFITVAKALTVKDPNGRIKTAGAALGTYDNVTHAPDIMSLLLLQNGANFQKLGNSQNATDALTFYSSFARPTGNVWDDTLDNSLLAFSRGSLAMYFGYSYDIFTIKAAAPNLNFAIYPVPHLPGRDITIASYWVEGISNKSKHPKEALEFLSFLAKNQTRLYTEEAKTRSFGELYARVDLADQLKANPLLATFVNQYKQAQSALFVGDTDYDEYNGVLNRYLGNAMSSVLQDTSVDSAMLTLSQGVQQVTSQYAPKTP